MRQVNNLLNVLNDSLSVLLVDNSLWSWVDTNKAWSSESVELSLNKLIRLITGFSGAESFDLVAILLNSFSFFHQFFDVLLVFFGVSTGIDRFKERVLLVGNVSDDSLLGSDELLDYSYLVDKNLNLLLENINLLDVFSLLGYISSLLDDMNEVNNLSSDDSDSLDVSLDDSLLLDDNSLDLVDLGSFFLIEECNLSLLDDVDLSVNLLDGLSDINDLLGQTLKNNSVFLDLLDNNSLLGWLSNQSSSESSNSSSDDNSLSNQFVDSNIKFLNDLSEFDDLFLD